MNNPEVIRRGFDPNGYWKDDVSFCCNSKVLYFNKNLNQYINQTGYENELSKEPICYRCYRQLKQKYSKHQIKYFKKMFLKEVSGKMPFFKGFVEKNIDRWIKV